MNTKYRLRGGPAHGLDIEFPTVELTFPIMRVQGVDYVRTQEMDGDYVVLEDSRIANG